MQSTFLPLGKRLLVRVVLLRALAWAGMCLIDRYPRNLRVRQKYVPLAFFVSLWLIRLIDPLLDSASWRCSPPIERSRQTQVDRTPEDEVTDGKKKDPFMPRRGLCMPRVDGRADQRPAHGFALHPTILLQCMRDTLQHKLLALATFELVETLRWCYVDRPS